MRDPREVAAFEIRPAKQERNFAAEIVLSRNLNLPKECDNAVALFGTNYIAITLRFDDLFDRRASGRSLHCAADK